MPSRAKDKGPYLSKLNTFCSKFPTQWNGYMFCFIGLVTVSEMVLKLSGSCLNDSEDTILAGLSIISYIAFLIATLFVLRYFPAKNLKPLFNYLSRFLYFTISVTSMVLENLNQRSHCYGKDNR